jgi:hypothetical protein
LSGVADGISLSIADMYALFRAGSLALLFDLLANLKRPIHSDPVKEILCHFSIDPPVDLDFVVPVQLPNLVFDLGGIHNGFFTFQAYEHRSAQPLAPILLSMGYSCFFVEQEKVAGISLADFVSGTIRHWARCWMTQTEVRTGDRQIDVPFYLICLS